MYWEIEPSNDSDFDIAELPGESEEDHHAALEFATERLFELFDALTEGESATVTVRCRKGKMENS